MDWHPGDRVKVELMDRKRPRRHGQRVLVTGTVREVDPPGLPRGVRVDLDRLVNGVGRCFATHAELHAAE